MTPDFLQQINWKLLYEQKQFLIGLAREESDGIVSLLDTLQDYCVDVLNMPEEVVFNLNSDNE